MSDHRPSEDAPLPAPVTEFVDVRTGEFLPATVENAARAISAAREMKRRIEEVVAAATAYLADESRRQGTKTLRHGDAEVVLKGGTATEYDPERLAELLRAAGCPEDRIAETVVPTVSYTVNRAVLRQLTGANPDYRQAAEMASRIVETRTYATVKGTP